MFAVLVVVVTGVVAGIFIGDLVCYDPVDEELYGDEEADQ